VNERQTIAAFFDIDGTLVPSGSLEWRFVFYLLSRGQLGVRNALRWLLNGVRRTRLGWRAAIEENKFYLAGLPESLEVEWADSMALQHSIHKSIHKSVYKMGPFSGEGVQRIAWHQSLNHRVFLVSGTLAPLARAVANFLPGTVAVVATELAESKQRAGEHRGCAVWSGELCGEHMVGAAKRRAVQALAAKYSLNLDESYAYGDSVADCAMLECVGHPEVVNPSRRMALLARRRGWLVRHWQEDGQQERRPEDNERNQNASKIMSAERFSVPTAREQIR
jgi:HAD superfamily hydrolase (TIGR01490 family)